jgi:hypothetical protein
LSLNGTDWASLLAWASTSTSVDPYDLKVASTVLGYALGGWQQEPTAKQAARAVRIMDAAESAGILEGV